MRLALALVAAFAAACSAPAPTGHLRAIAQRPWHLPPGARAPFEPERFDIVFGAAVRAVRARGGELVTCDPVYGKIATATVEIDAPCGASTCLARQLTTVKLGYRRARVTVTREIWDSTLREWREPDDATSVANILREQQELVEAAIQQDMEHAETRLAQACGSDPCDVSACVASSAAVDR
jgi:hypothetical protein